MAQPRGNGGGDNNNMEMWVFLIVVIFVIIFWALKEIFWIYATAWQWIRLAELGIASFIVPDFIERLTGWDFEGGFQFLVESDPEDLTAEIIGTFDNIYVRFFNWLPGLFLAFLGARLFLNADNVSNTYNMEQLLIKMSSAFPSNKKFINVHPELTTIDFYPDDPASYEYSMVMTERQLAECVPPLGLAEEATKDKTLMRPIWDGDKGFDDELARRCFEKQVGPLYRGYKKLSPIEAKLFESFRSQVLVKRKEIIPIIQYYATQIFEHRVKMELIPTSDAQAKKINIDTWPKPTVTLMRDYMSHKALVEKLTKVIDSGIKEKGRQFQLTEIAIRHIGSMKEFKSNYRAIIADNIMGNHAFTYTGLMSLLLAAREGATLPPSSFRWLKGENRTLWYALNCVGKKVSFTESAGAFAHWLLEREAKIAVPHPEVTEAIEALRVALGLPPRFQSTEVTDQWG